MKAFSHALEKILIIEKMKYLLKPNESLALKIVEEELRLVLDNTTKFKVINIFLLKKL